uniref:Unspecific monooxygenase n=1 Tax=Caenorhabditis tropicalis TaxID=1561998 RepID=A0A1I7TXS3_9PELO
MGVLSTNGEHWQEMRRFSLQTFRNMGVGKNVMETRIIEELDKRCADIDKAAVNGSTVIYSADFFDLTVGSIINSILVGKRFEEHNKDEFLKIKNALDNGFEVFTVFDMILPVWFTKYFMKIIMNTLKKFQKFKSGEYIVDENNLNDYTDAFLLKIQQEGENRDFNLSSLQTMLLDLWITGQETTSTTLVSGFSNLLLNPHIVDKTRNEIMKITNNGTRALSLEDRPSTPFLNAVIGEIQRHASILNINFMRNNYEPTFMGGHLVDGGCLVSAQLGVLHVNDEMFENPYEFDPERFLRDEKLLQKVIPFGLGKRSCLGEALARSELYLIFGNLLLRYQFRPHGKLSTVELNPFSAAKKPYKMKLEFIKI